MKLNPIEMRIVEILTKDIIQNKLGYSSLTNTDIAKQLNISVYSIRDKITKLCDKKVLVRRTNFWDIDMKYHQRVIYLAGA